MHLGDIKVGQWGRIVALAHTPSAYRSRLIAMGLLPGTRFQMVRVAPLGDPCELWVRGMSLVLRQQEAAILTIEAEPACQL